MSLVIYTDLGNVNKDIFITDVETAFRCCGIDGNYFNMRVLRDLEKSEYVDDGIFRDRFGVLLYASSLSTSSKALICLNSFPDKIVNFVEVGKGVGDLLLLVNNGSIYIPFERLSGLFYSLEDRRINVLLNNKRFVKYSELLEYVEELS